MCMPPISRRRQKAIMWLSTVMTSSILLATRKSMPTGLYRRNFWAILWGWSFSSQTRNVSSRIVVIFLFPDDVLRWKHDYLPVDRESRWCRDCHRWKEPALIKVHLRKRKRSRPTWEVNQSKNNLCPLIKIIILCCVGSARLLKSLWWLTTGYTWTELWKNRQQEKMSSSYSPMSTLFWSRPHGWMTTRLPPLGKIFLFVHLIFYSYKLRT